MTFRSKLEELVARQLGPNWAYEPYKMAYVVPHHYTPDFVTISPGGYEILVEVKGFFRAGDRQKYKAIRDRLNTKEGDEELVFLLSHPNKKTHKGAMQTMAQWCEKEGFRWFQECEELVQYAEEVDNADS